MMATRDAEGTPISEMLKRGFLKFGVPKQIVMDNCPNFVSKSLSDVLKTAGNATAHADAPVCGERLFRS
jgi:hypothetical protein